MKEVGKLLPIVIAKAADTIRLEASLHFLFWQGPTLACSSCKEDERITRREDNLCVPPFTLIADKNKKERVYAWGTCQLKDRSTLTSTLMFNVSA